MNWFDRLPQAAEKRIAIHITPAAERALRRGHPWVFDGAIRKQSHDGRPGDLAVVFDSRRRFLAIGLYDPDSPLRVRVLHSGEPTPIDGGWFTTMLRTAAAIRQPLAASGTTGYRLVHGENDHLPGLVIDRYADTLVLKLYTTAWLPHLPVVVAALNTVQPSERLVLRLSRNMTAQAARFDLHDGQILHGDPVTEPIIFVENDLRFAADVVQGHKTGFFFDQRDNRARVRDLAAGRRLLDVFAYSGGFSVYGAAGGATHVTSLDVSQPALDAARANLALNAADESVAAANHEVIAADAFAGLDDLHRSGRVYDLVIVDPPSFAKSAAEVESALSAYTQLTRAALAVLAPGGVAVLASCSSRVTRADFFATVTRAATDAGRPLREIDRTGHALDHPIRYPEGEYLKCLFATAP